MADPLDKIERVGYNVTSTPYPEFEPETGYLCLRDGVCRQILCRFQKGRILVWWKKGKTEIELTLDDFLEGYLASKK